MKGLLNGQRLSPPVSFVVFVAAISSLTAHHGSDLANYDFWAQIAISGDINQRTFLAIEDSEPVTLRDYQSVKGVQYRHWSAGPGLFIAAHRLALMPLGWSQNAAHIAGYLCVFSFWWLLYISLRRMSDELCAVLGIALAYTATNLGFYSCYVSLEAYSLLPIGLLLNEATKYYVGERPNALVGGTATGMLLMFRSYVGAYAWCALIPIFIAQFRSEGDGVWRRVARVAMLVLPVAAAIWQIGTVHWWMTAHFTQSPYGFGDAEFQSLSSACPHLWQVLLSPFHGALVYSPLTAVGLVVAVVLAVQAFRRREWPAASIWGLLLLAVACNIFFAGAWHLWWMAAWFGNRNLYLTGVVAVLAIVKGVHSSSGWPKNLLLSLSAIATMWSFLLLQRGRVSYFTLQQMLRDTGLDIEYWMSLERVVIAAIAFVVAAAAVLLINREKGDIYIKAATILTVALTLCYLGDRLAVTRPPLLPAYVCVAVSLVCGVWGLSRMTEPMRFVAPVAFAMMLVLFCRLYALTSEKTCDNPTGLRYPIYDLVYNLRSITGLDVIAAEREQLLQYLRRHEGEAWYESFRNAETNFPVLIQGRNFRYKKTAQGYRYL